MLILEKEEWHDSETDSCANSIWTKILGFFSYLTEIVHSITSFYYYYFLIHMKLFKCFNDESFVIQCLEITPHKGDSSIISSIHKNREYSIPNEGSSSLVQIHIIVFYFWIKGTSKPKLITLNLLHYILDPFFTAGKELSS